MLRLDAAPPLLDLAEGIRKGGSAACFAKAPPHCWRPDCATGSAGVSGRLVAGRELWYPLDHALPTFHAQGEPRFHQPTVAEPSPRRSASGRRPSRRPQEREAVQDAGRRLCRRGRLRHPHDLRARRRLGAQHPACQGVRDRTHGQATRSAQSARRSRKDRRPPPPRRRSRYPRRRQPSGIRSSGREEAAQQSTSGMRTRASPAVSPP
jgi:hypothetical protein